MAKKTSSSQKLSMEIKRQHSYTTLARLIGGGDKTTSPAATPSPEGAVQMKKVVERLEEIDRESRELLQKLFSMLEKDARLERYVRKRLEDPKVSRMWELVEQILSTHHAHIDIHSIASNSYVIEEEDQNGISWAERGLKTTESSNEGMRMERFKIRTLDTSDVAADHAYPVKTVQK